MDEYSKETEELKTEAAEEAAAAEAEEIEAEETAEAAAEPEEAESGRDMVRVVNVQFRNRGKAYYFDPGEFEPRPGDAVVVETSKGLELGNCTEGVHAVAESSVVQPLRPVVRMATREDIRVGELNRAREKTAFGICEDKIRAHKLDMKLVDVEYSFEGGKILFFFTSDGRVDFRELVKDLAGVFHTRIELRQIGVRDGAKMLGGLGICGRPFCCSTFLEEFQPVSIRMAKTQNLSLNPSKISGTCGRLMCCLKYEQDAYEHLIKTMPKVDAPVDTPKGKGSVTEVNLLRRTVKVRLADQSETAVQSYHVDRLGYTINGEYIEPKPEEEKQVEPAMPDLSLYMADKPETDSRDEDRKSRFGRKGGRNQKGGRQNRQSEEGEGWEPRREQKEKPARAAEQKERAPRPEGERNDRNDRNERGERNERNDRKKGDFRPRNGKPKPHNPGGNPAGEGQQQPRQPREPRPPREFRGGKEAREGHPEGRPEGRPPREPRPPKEQRPPKNEQAQGGDAAPAGRADRKPGGFNKKHYYHRDRKKPGGEKSE